MTKMNDKYDAAYSVLQPSSSNKAAKDLLVEPPVVPESYTETTTHAPTISGLLASKAPINESPAYVIDSKNHDDAVNKNLTIRLLQWLHIVFSIGLAIILAFFIAVVAYKYLPYYCRKKYKISQRGRSSLLQTNPETVIC